MSKKQIIGQVLLLNIILFYGTGLAPVSAQISIPGIIRLDLSNPTPTPIPSQPADSSLPTQTPQPSASPPPAPSSPVPSISPSPTQSPSSEPTPTPVSSPPSSPEPTFTPTPTPLSTTHIPTRRATSTPTPSPTVTPIHTPTPTPEPQAATTEPNWPPESGIGGVLGAVDRQIEAAVDWIINRIISPDSLVSTKAESSQQKISAPPLSMLLSPGQGQSYSDQPGTSQSPSGAFLAGLGAMMLVAGLALIKNPKLEFIKQWPEWFNKIRPQDSDQQPGRNFWLGWDNK